MVIKILTLAQHNLPKIYPFFFFYLFVFYSTIALLNKKKNPKMKRQQRNSSDCVHEPFSVFVHWPVFFLSLHQYYNLLIYL